MVKTLLVPFCDLFGTFSSCFNRWYRCLGFSLSFQVILCIVKCQYNNTIVGGDYLVFFPLVNRVKIKNK